LSDKDVKKKDISDLKARLGLKKGARPETSSAQGAPTPGVTPPPRGRANYVPPPPGVAPPGGAVAQPAAPKSGGSAVYLTDKELLEAQSATDDGEVVE